MGLVHPVNCSKTVRGQALNAIYLKALLHYAFFSRFFLVFLLTFLDTNMSVSKMDNRCGNREGVITSGWEKTGLIPNR